MIFIFVSFTADAEGTSFIFINFMTKICKPG